MPNITDIIANTPQPRTTQSIARDLRALGIREGDTIIVHCSLSSLGWINGGAVALILALTDVLTPEGTLVMPAHSGDWSDPINWNNPPVPEAWKQQIRDTMPAFDPAITPTRAIGTVAELFRTFPGVVRSSHPSLSFSARGKHAAAIVENHSLENALGEGSPLARLYDLDASVLLLGVGYGSNTSMHLSEYRSGVRETIFSGAPILENGQRVWKQYQDIDFDSDEFHSIGADFEKQNSVRTGAVGSANCRLMKVKELVDFGTNWLMTAHAISL